MRALSLLLSLLVVPAALAQTSASAGATSSAVAPVSSARSSAPPSDTSTSESTTISSATSSSVSQSISASLSVSESISVSVSASANISASLSVNASMTSTSLAPNATATGNSTTNATATDIGEDNYLAGYEDEIEAPSQLMADEQVTRLVYTANYDQNECRRLASSYAAKSSVEMRRHWSEVSYKRKRSLVPQRCLPAVGTIHTWIHWVPHTGATSAWYNRTAMWESIYLTQRKLAVMGFGMNIRGIQYWKANDRLSVGTENDKEYMVGYVNKVKNLMEGSNMEAVNARFSKLHIFIVHRPGGRDSPDIAGFANFPGIGRIRDQSDCVFVGANTMVGNRGGFDDWSGSARQGTTWPHEIGHWLGLNHLHDSGCRGSDGIGETLQYPITSGKPDYSLSCADKNGNRQAKGAGGAREYNMMSYASGRTRTNSQFIPAQAARAAAGFWIRRRGLAGQRLNINDDTVYLKACPKKASLKRDFYESRGNTSLVLPHPDHVLVPRDLPTFTKRQMAGELSSFCQSRDLLVDNYNYGELAEQGLYNPTSPAIPNAPAPAPSSASADPGTVVNQEAGQSSYEQVKASVEQRTSSGGSVAVPEGQAGSSTINPPTAVIPSTQPSAPSSAPSGAAGRKMGMGWVNGLGLGLGEWAPWVAVGLGALVL